MKTKQRRRKRRIAPAGLMLISIIALGGVWFADAVRRAVETPSGNVEWTTEPTNASETPTEPPATTQPPTKAPLLPEATESVQIQDAATDLFEKPKDPVPEGYTLVAQDESGVYNGRLLQLDQNHPYTGTVGELTTFHGKNTSYRMKRLDFNTRPEVLEAMNEMGNAYVADTGAVNLMIYSTMAPYDAPGSLYPDALPDRSSGYCLDFCILNPDETINKIKSPNTWLESHSWKYGFVFSYTGTDTELSGVSAAPYHLRYVGKVHAALLHENNLTLAEYHEFIREYTVDEPLSFTLGEITYSIYFEPSVAASTDIALPLEKNYEISGNNSDGFIVTVQE